MSAAGKRRFRSVIEEAISSKPNIADITADTFRSDAAAILEAMIAEFDESDVLKAMRNQGFKAEAYRSTIKALAKVASERRLQRKAGAASLGRSPCFTADRSAALFRDAATGGH